MDARQKWPVGTFVGHLSLQERSSLFRLGTRQSFRGGHFLLRQREAGRGVFVVISGRVEILMRDRREREQRIAVRVAGDVLGEMAFMDARPRSASAMADGPVIAHRLPREAFNRFFEECPDAYRHLVKTLVDRLRASDSRQLETGRDVESRLAAAICQLATTEGNGQERLLIVRRTQRELGQMIDASTVSIHRALRKLAGRDCLRTEYRAIVILDFEGLAAVAGSRTTMHRLM
ncbi:Crp/Fnr family transcriptional regulator [Paractinoplanes maris]|uniref:Crp/Fnr family transcriptional regulator n=1 Tax=Paractinoplanes maris TaxID=1734446 RepID=UPI00201FFCBF|nr:Crp/Fnr family transcriptional regulator [Actinoplanes maris]